MSPSFFEHQELARRNSRVMVALFLLAVAAVVTAVVAALAGIYAATLPDVRGGALVPWSERLGAVPAGFYALAALATAGVILLVSLVNVARLARGGPAVAQMVGARAVSPETRDPLERRLINVVEEMSIASGVRVPGIYVMDGERGINAFAAGWDVSGAVVAVTRGMLETLSRDELQGVVAHEFSHILHGDMRLNVRMLGVLAGIVFIGAIGEFAMRGARGSRDKGAYVWAAGLALFLIGWIGLFFARLIKAAVSREREFLADASSVQFTRNPEGIAGALDQIRGASDGALIASRYAEDLSHMFFGASIRQRLGGLLATHPPLDERIRRVHPRFDAASYRQARAAAGDAPRAATQQSGRRAEDAAAAWGRSAAASVALVGTLDAEKIDYATRLLHALPPELREKLRDPEGAAAVVLEVAAQKSGLKLAYRLPVVDLALPALKRLPEERRPPLLAKIEAAVHADRRVSPHEFVVLALVRSQLAPPAKGPAPEGRKLAELREEAELVASLMHPEHAERPVELARLEQALEKLASLAPLEKARLVEQLFSAAIADGRIRVAEAELLRLMGAVLRTPLPPLVEKIGSDPIY